MAKNLLDLGTKKDNKEIHILTTKERAAGTQKTKKQAEKQKGKRMKYRKMNNSTLFSEKLFKNSNTLSMPINMPNLPMIKEQKIENIKYRRGETERILVNEYYQNCYNSSIKISRFNSDLDTNDALRNNYNRLWDNVNDYKEKLNYKSVNK